VPQTIVGSPRERVEARYAVFIQPNSCSETGWGSVGQNNVNILDLLAKSNSL
jgi:hypothetical protein